MDREADGVHVGFGMRLRYGECADSFVVLDQAAIADLLGEVPSDRIDQITIEQENCGSGPIQIIKRADSNLDVRQAKCLLRRWPYI